MKSGRKNKRDSIGDIDGLFDDSQVPIIRGKFPDLASWEFDKVTALTLKFMSKGIIYYTEEADLVRD